VAGLNLGSSSTAFRSGRQVPLVEARACQNVDCQVSETSVSSDFFRTTYLRLRTNMLPYRRHVTPEFKVELPSLRKGVLMQI